MGNAYIYFELTFTNIELFLSLSFRLINHLNSLKL